MPATDMNPAIATVLDVAEHFERLKRRAEGLLDELGASARGFFTPTEDEQVRQVLVSYWHSRNALVEVVIEAHRDDPAATVDERNTRFLVALAGALVLIDAGRFLREHIHGRPVVRRKLNEPEPAFGIPGGVYDRIQASLTSPVHAWYLFHALRYLEENEDALERLAASEGQLGSLYELMTRLRHRLKVRLEDLVVARVRVHGRRLRTGFQRDLLFRALYGLQKVVSQFLSEKYTRPGHAPGLPRMVVAQILAQLSPGDVLITRKEYAVTNYFLPGYWPHAALYVGRESTLAELGLADDEQVRPWLAAFHDCGGGEESRVLEALKDGVRIRPTSSPLGCDAIAVLRPRLEREDVRTALARGFRHVGKPYDFDFDFTRSDRLVCSEVVYRSYEGLGGLTFALTRRTGRMTLSAEDLLLMSLRSQGFQPVAAYAPGFTTQLQWSAGAVEMLQKTLRQSENTG